MRSRPRRTSGAVAIVVAGLVVGLAAFADACPRLHPDASWQQRTADEQKGILIRLRKEQLRFVASSDQVTQRKVILCKAKALLGETTFASCLSSGLDGEYLRCFEAARNPLDQVYLAHLVVPGYIMPDDWDRSRGLRAMLQQDRR